MDGMPSSSGLTPTPATSGTLKTKISLKSGQIVTPFHTFKTELPAQSEIQGSYDLLAAYDLGPVYKKFCKSRKIKDDLVSFLPHMYGNFTFSSSADAGSLKALVEKPPITKEISTFSASTMQGFNLSRGTVDEKYRSLFHNTKRKEEPDHNIIYHEGKDLVMGRMTMMEPSMIGNSGYDSSEELGKKKKKKKKDKKEKKNKKMKLPRSEEFREFASVPRDKDGKPIMDKNPDEAGEKKDVLKEEPMETL